MDLLDSLAPQRAANGRFSGTVARDTLGRPGDQPEVTLIDCGLGSMTEEHRHPGGQVLIAVTGSLHIVGEDGTEHQLRPGEGLRTAPGERHCHGAAKGSEATFVAVTWGGTAWTNP